MRGPGCAALALAVMLLVTACSSSAPHRAPVTSRARPSTTVARTSPTVTASSSPVTASSPTVPVRRAVTTPQGMWWGVDSTVPIDAASLGNVRHWYRGHPTPQFWGRYVRGHYAVSRAELAFARARGIYVALIVPDHNCSGCAGGDVCGQDRTAAQARADATRAIMATRRLGIAAGALLFKDIEEVGGCDGPSTAYLIAWYRTLRDTEFRAGFYANVHRQDFAFPRAYCAARRSDQGFADDVVLDMNEDEPRIGAPRGSTGPRNAPPFRPKSPDCASREATVIWQYGESLSDDNVTDIDQARPDIAGLLAPDGGVSG